MSYMNKNQKATILKIISCKFIFIILANLLAIVSFAQNDTIVPIDKNPEELLKDLNLKVYRQQGFNLWNDDFTGHWAGFDLGFNIFVNEDYSGYDTPFLNNDIIRSNSAYINLIQKNFGLQRNRNTIGLLTGIGLQLQSYRLENNTSLQLMSDGTIEPQNLLFDQNHKSKLSIVSIILPLLSEYQIPVNQYNNRIYVSGGFYGGLRIGSHTKIKYRSEGKKEKLKTPGHYSLQDFKYGMMIRAGYRWINVFATYELVPLFKGEKGPRLTPVTVGITLINL
mgnify:CR=1 FL=1